MKPSWPHAQKMPASDVDDDARKSRVKRKLKILSIVTIALTTLVAFFAVFVLTVYDEAKLIGGYLNSIPRIVERRDAYLAATNALYSREFAIRGDIAVMLYDTAENADTLERLKAAKEAVGAADIALVDEDGNVLADTGVVTPAPASTTQDQPDVIGEAGGVDAGQGETEKTDATANPGAEEIVGQVINSDENLFIVNEEKTGDAIITLDTAFDSGEEGEEGEAQDTSDEVREASTDASGGTGAGPTEVVSPAQAKGEATEQTDGENTASAEDEAGAEEVTDADDEADDAALGETPVTWSAVEVDRVTDEEEATLPGTYVYYRAKASNGLNLIIKFDPTTLLGVNQEEGQWERLLERLLAGIDAYAFVREDETGTWRGYPIASITDEELGVITSKLTNIEERVSFTIPFAAEKGLLGVRFGIMSLLGKTYLVELRALPEEGLTFVMAIPFSRFFPGPQRSCLMVALFLITSVFLLVRFIRVVMAGMSAEGDEKERQARLRTRCYGGLVVVVIVLTLFAVMSILLNKSATTSKTARAQRASLVYELEHHDAIVQQAVEENNDAAITQANALARLLTERPQLRNRADIQRLADIVGARYLMLFDKDGKELFSSNSYVGFRVAGDDGSYAETMMDAKGLQAMLLGEPCVVSDPILDGRGVSYHIIASLITNQEDLPDGFLVMAVDDTETVDAQINDLSLLMNNKDLAAIVVDDESGRILKHSDATLVGDPISSYLRKDVLGRSYEGYTWYENKYVYMSSDSSDGISTIVLSTNTMGIEGTIVLVLFVFLNIVLICLLFYPQAIKYCFESSDRKGRAPRLTRPFSVFLYGYNLFFCCLSIIAYVSSSRGNWPAFSAVFEGAWSRGINQFAVWSALFFNAQATTLVFVAKRLLDHLSERENLAAARTIIRLCDSLINYILLLVVMLVDLSFFGVDTTALIASAGIVSIAVGMGAKDLIADILAGVFIIFESSVQMGDIVEIDGWRGTITDMGIRTCEITDRYNNVKVINNSKISELVNYSRKNTPCSVEFELDRDILVSEVPSVVDEYVKALAQEVPEIGDSLRYAGITDITENCYKVAISWSCEESKREKLTLKVNNAMRLLLEGGIQHATAEDAQSRS